MDIDYLVSSTSVCFAAGASDGAESCITIIAICDSLVEGDEEVTVALPGDFNSTYAIDSSRTRDSFFTSLAVVTILDGKKHYTVLHAEYNN